MKRIINLLLLLPVMVTMFGCNDDEIVFDHELPQFEIRDNAILLEVILPSGSQATDTYYILGEFNGGDDAIGDATWQLQKAENNDMKWGIYLVPSTFINGKTLSDGYYFYSVAQGEERSVNNTAVLHKTDAGVGTRTNVWVDRWEAYFNSGNETQKDYYTVYVDDQTTWNITHLYAWHDDVGGDIDGAWPGWAVSGTTVNGSYTFKYFDIPEAFNGDVMNLIFNNDAGSQINGPQNYTNGRDLYLTVTDAGFTEIDPGDLEGPYYGYTIYADDQTGWSTLNMYAWIDGQGDADPDAGWPGWEAHGTTEINGVTYTSFRPGEDLNGAAIYIIFNDGSNELPSYGITLDKDYYFVVTSSSLTEVDPWDDGPVVKESRTIYFQDNGWSTYNAHYYDGAGLTTSWPGVASDGTVTYGGITYHYFNLTEDIDGMTLKFIFNDGSSQLNDIELTLDRDYFLEAINQDVYEKVFTVYASDMTGGWDLKMHYWHDYGWTTVWPGISPDGQQVVNGVVYDFFLLDSAVNGYEVGLIFNDNGSPQLDQNNIVANRDYYFEVTTGGAVEVTP
ncbi:MAG: starch-binding protein [Alistipes sp.]|nr:starch-binding protein [Alistipes sp.]